MSSFKSTFVLIFILFTQTSFSQKMTPEQIVQENLDFYNNRNITGFMSSFSDDIQVFNLGDPKPTVVGKSEVERVYSTLFKNSPKLHSTILKRIVFGNTVIDHESIVGRHGMKEVLELVLIYEVNHQKISKITVLRK